MAEFDNILRVKYFGFSSFGNSLAKYFFNCEDAEDYDEDGIKESCQYADANGNENKEAYEITDLSAVQSENYIVNFPFYVQAEGGARVLLQAATTSRREVNRYEIGEDFLSFDFFCILYLSFNIRI